MKKRVPDTRNDRIKNFVDKKYLDDIMNVVNTLMRRVTCWKIQREMQLLEASYWKICEDYLGVPLIQAGDSVIIERAVHRKQIGATHGELGSFSYAGKFMYKQGGTTE